MTKLRRQNVFLKYVISLNFEKTLRVIYNNKGLRMTPAFKWQQNGTKNVWTLREFPLCNPLAVSSFRLLDESFPATALMALDTMLTNLFEENNINTTQFKYSFCCKRREILPTEKTEAYKMSQA